MSCVIQKYTSLILFPFVEKEAMQSKLNVFSLEKINELNQVVLQISPLQSNSDTVQK